MKKPITVRSLSEADSAYAAALDLRQRLRDKLSELDREEARHLAQLAQPKSSTVAETAAVAALLGDAVEEDADPSGARGRLRVIQTERQDARRALEIAEGRLRMARMQASRIIVDEVRDEYIARVRALAAALATANTAHESLLSLISDLNAADVAWNSGLQPMQATNLFGHRGERVGHWLRSAKAAGYIDQLPREFAE